MATFLIAADGYSQGYWSSMWVRMEIDDVEVWSVSAGGQFGGNFAVPTTFKSLPLPAGAHTVRIAIGGSGIANLRSDVVLTNQSIPVN